MGQRSQIYIRFSDKDNKHYLTAKYFQWNYSERMISRARHTIEWIQSAIKYEWLFSTQTENLKRILDVNFDMQDVQIGIDIIKEYNEDSYWKEEGYSINDYVFNCQDNNDGKLFIDIKDNQIKYAFIDSECNLNYIMDGNQYMNWEYNYQYNSKDIWITGKYLDYEQKLTCIHNIEEIEKIATLMTKEELEDFMTCHYENV